MALIDLISEDIIKTPLVSQTKNQVIHELIEVLAEAQKIGDPNKVYEAVLKREDQGSTGLERGIAIPHAKTEEVKTLTLALGIAPHGIEFYALDGNPSKLFFLLLAAPDQSGPHIEALAEIARITKSEAFCRMLLSAKTSKEVVNIIKED